MKKKKETKNIGIPTDKSIATDKVPINEKSAGDMINLSQQKLGNVKKLLN